MPAYHAIGLSRTGVVFLLALLAGCVSGRGVQTLPAPAPLQVIPRGARAMPAEKPATPRALSPLPTLRAPTFVAVNNPAGLSGSVQFGVVDEPYFSNSQAPYRLQAGKPAQAAIVTVGLLDETLYTVNGQVITTTTDASGAFLLPAARPATGACVVQAAFVGGHRLSALVDPSATSVLIDEGTSMVTEMARWQLFSTARADEPDLTDVASPTLASLHALTQNVLGNITLPVNAESDTPRVDALLTGSGHLLRNAYVEYFGARTTPQGQTSTPAAANTLSDTWHTVLGFRPLALTRLAGNGTRGYDQSENRPAGEVAIANPADVVTDAQGNVFFSQLDLNLISLVPRLSLAGPYLGSAAPTLTSGHIYAVVGFPGNERSPLDWEANFREGAPLTGGGSIYAPYRLALEANASDAARNHLYFSSPLTGRVMLVTSGDLTHFGDVLLGNRLYTVAGQGIYSGAALAGPAADWEAQNGQNASEAGLWRPTGLARDAAGNVFVVDAGSEAEDRPGRLLVVRESDGLIFHLPLEDESTAEGVSLSGVEDLKLHPSDGKLYFADTLNHCVRSLSCPTSTDIANFDENPIATLTVVIELGQPGTEGFIDTAGGAQYPDIHDISKGIPTDDILLDGPRSITFDAAGQLIVGDTGNGRVRLRKDNLLYTLAGGLDTRFVTGDARLGYFPGIDSVHYSPFERNLLVTDFRASVVRRIHTNRGILD